MRATYFVTQYRYYYYYHHHFLSICPKTIIVKLMDFLCSLRWTTTTSAIQQTTKKRTECLPTDRYIDRHFRHVLYCIVLCTPHSFGPSSSYCSEIRLMILRWNTKKRWHNFVFFMHSNLTHFRSVPASAPLPPYIYRLTFHCFFSLSLCSILHA